MSQPTVEFFLEIVKKTPDAILFTDGDEKMWIPRSQIISMTRIEKRDYEVEVTEWFAYEKDMI